MRILMSPPDVSSHTCTGLTCASACSENARSINAPADNNRRLVTKAGLALALTCGLCCAFPLAIPALAAGLGVTAAVVATDTLTSAGQLTVVDVKNALDRKENIYIVDANERESYLAGHIPGAQWVRYDAVATTNLPTSKDTKLVFYCYNPRCGASPLAAKTALALGYRHVWLMPEGITGWRSAGMPIVSGATPY